METLKPQEVTGFVEIWGRTSRGRERTLVRNSGLSTRLLSWEVTKAFDRWADLSEPVSLSVKWEF